MYRPFASSPTKTGPVTLTPQHTLEVSAGDPWGHAVLAAWQRRPEAERPHLEMRSPELEPQPTPVTFHVEGELSSDDPLAVARALAPDLFGAGVDDIVAEIRAELIDPIYALGAIDDQASYEAAYAEVATALERWNGRLATTRFVLGDDPGALCFGDFVLWAFLVRIDPVYYELYKAAAFLLSDLPELHGYACDLYDLQPELAATTSWHAIKALHHLHAPVVNPRQLVPSGGIPNLDAPSFRAERFTEKENDDATEEDPARRRGAGEWVRPQSGMRHWISTEPNAQYPAEAGRYHLYAPFNCPWSHRALLARGVLGLENVIGASVVYFRRHPEKGWQFNPSIPGCTEDEVHGSRFVGELYEMVGSDERSVPVLWDTATSTIVSNESAEILRMLNGAFGPLAERDVDLYPERYREEIDRLGAMIYQRINNGAYKAGFARSQHAYERAFARYFAALDYLEDLLGERRWLAGSETFTEADLRLFPTLYRHDAVYYSRFRLNLRRVSDYPRSSDWLGRMLAVPGIAASSNMDHARNGYFGRTGNEIVPAGPIPLGLSRSQFSPEVWLAEA